MPKALLRGTKPGFTTAAAMGPTRDRNDTCRVTASFSIGDQFYGMEKGQ